MGLQAMDGKYDPFKVPLSVPEQVTAKQRIQEAVTHLFVLHAFFSFREISYQKP